MSVGLITNRHRRNDWQLDPSFAERGERMVLMLLGLFFHKLGAAMWMLAFLAWLTTLQRLVHTHRALEAGQHRAPPEPAQG